MAFLEFEPHLTFGEARLKMWFLAEAQRSPVKMGTSHRCPCFDLNIILHECCKRKGWVPVAKRVPCTPADSKRASYAKSTLGAVIDWMDRYKRVRLKIGLLGLFMHAPGTFTPDPGIIASLITA